MTLRECMKKISTGQMVKMCDGLIASLEQCAFISEQEITSIHSIKEKLLRQKHVLRSVTVRKGFKKAFFGNAYSSLENPVSGSSLDIQLQRGFRDSGNLLQDYQATRKDKYLLHVLRVSFHQYKFKSSLKIFLKNKLYQK